MQHHPVVQDRSIANACQVPNVPALICIVATAFVDSPYAVLEISLVLVAKTTPATRQKMANGFCAKLACVVEHLVNKAASVVIVAKAIAAATVCIVSTSTVTNVASLMAALWVISDAVVTPSAVATPILRVSRSRAKTASAFGPIVRRVQSPVCAAATIAATMVLFVKTARDAKRCVVSLDQQTANVSLGAIVI
jgi:hypothetical protein